MPDGCELDGDGNDNRGDDCLVDSKLAVNDSFNSDLLAY